MPTTCQLPSQPSQEWSASHNAYHDSAMDGFVSTPISPGNSLTSGPVAMGYWTGDDLPFTYSLARTFPIGDRWFCSALAQTFPNRRYLIAGTSAGMTDNGGLSDLTLVVPPAGTIFNTLDRFGISWENYVTAFPLGATPELFPVNDATTEAAHHKAFAEFFTDAGGPVLSEPLAAPEGRGGYVVFCAAGQLLAVDAADGRLAWSVPGRGFSAGRAACDGERVYTAAADGYARAHDLRTGREAWSRELVSGDRHRVALYSGWDDVVALGAGVVVVATVSGSQALDPATGTLRWAFPGSTMYPPAVVLGDGTVLLTTEQGVVSRVSLADGGIIWQASLGVRVQNAGLAVAGDSAWVVSEGGRLVRVRLADGRERGSVRPTTAGCYCAPAVVGDTLRGRRRRRASSPCWRPAARPAPAAR